MKLAFSLFKYFPYGGLQRDCVKIAEEAISRGHSVDIFALQAEGNVPSGINLHVLPQRASRNYKRYETFADQFQLIADEGGYDGLVGFNKMPGLDIYYAADPCFAAKAAERSFFYRWAGRTRSFLSSERKVFGPDSNTEILLISPREEDIFSQIYGTDASRMHQLPPGIQKDRQAGEDYPLLREQKRSQLGLQDKKMLLMVGSGFKTKGLDRSLRAVASLPERLREQVMLYVVGKDNVKPFQRQANSLGIEKQFVFMGGRDDVADLLFAADLLLHPAYRENTGTVLLEAVAATLPLLVSDVCGYSFHVKAAQCGEVLTEPFSQDEMNAKLRLMLEQPKRELWQENARRYIKFNDIFSMPQRAVDVIERVLS
ncbi:UDP-glucose:(heptosyl)LPS alpha-1,3-glucosyltransferase [Malonomonas rubra DSM 5091]|uniref:UDP-glucose:(Heptosyl)LPS alpha-1,3-glucosyltransferase n=1 Tax=Malonomonas rubra DSM 5091 TaxID=1122189 RepID=A0A1M6C7H8_MALRU|nr:glycosyltransferase family 4 protein [Malonomonas rubra]SHI57000.1 UDP-glucose:(heptosyl)LPS alpha-1,3-glucosyltransferase [Malonomonas rubra DSM 5091]